MDRRMGELFSLYTVLTKRKMTNVPGIEAASGGRQFLTSLN
jgi:hypothetical protein